MMEGFLDPNGHGLGYILGEEDPQNENYLVREIIEDFPPPERPWKYHFNGWTGDQGNTPSCIGFGFTHWLSDGPATHICKGRPPVNPMTVYNLARQIDQRAGRFFPGGATMVAGALALRELGFIESFHWAKTADELARVVNPEEPAVLGTSWRDGMLVENRKNRLARATGRNWGGHCWEVNGVNLSTGLFRGKNSHGDGLFWIPGEDIDVLMRDRGEICVMQLKAA